MSDDESGGDYSQSLPKIESPMIDVMLGETLGVDAILLRPTMATVVGTWAHDDAQRRAEEERIKKEQANKPNPAFVTYEVTPEGIARTKKLVTFLKHAAVVVCVLVASKLAYNRLTAPDYSVTDVAVGRKVRVKEGGAIGFAVGSSKQLKIPDGLVMTVVGLRSINDKAHSKYGIKKGATVIEADIGKDYVLLLTAASVEAAYPGAKIGRVDYFSPSVQKELLERQKDAQRKDTADFNNNPRRQKEREDRLSRERKYIDRLNRLGKN